ncbi:MAG: nucleoside hydrolase [Planctomycetota bacterium]
MSKTKILLDTDIGSDIDDSIALAYLLKQTKFDLLGITTCTGDTQQRAALAAAVCEAAGRGDIPIHAGAKGPFFHGPGQNSVPQYEALAGRAHRKNFPADAIQFLQQTIRANPGEVTLLAIGPLTNLALLFRMDPEIPSLLGQLVLMSGTFTGFPADQHGQHGSGPGDKEWNVRCDPYASAVVYEANCPNHLSVGLDVTQRCQLTSDEARRRFMEGKDPLPLVGEFAEIWFRERPYTTFHDPLAAAVIAEPELCRYQSGRVRVETDSPYLRGVTTFNPDSVQQLHRIAIDVDTQAFLDHYFAVVNA